MQSFKTIWKAGLGLLAAGALSGCGGSGSALGEEPTISGQVTNGWRRGDDTLYAKMNGHQLGSGTIASNGSFSIKLPPGAVVKPEVEEKEFCRPADRYTDYVCDFVTYFPPKPFMNVVSLETKNTSLELLHSLAPPTSPTAHYYYVLSDFELVGKLNAVSKNSGNVSTTTYDLHMKTGWNLLIFDQSAGISTIRTGPLPDGMMWVATSP